MKLESYIRDIQNFPKPGVVFKDITPLLANPKALEVCVHQIAELSNEFSGIDKVIGIESRGFIFAPIIARHFGAGFIPVRKKGKLPYTVKSKKYELEYGEDALEIHVDAITKGERILVHDDVLATGGTAKAVCDMVKEMGGVVVQCTFVIELTFLEGSKKLDMPIASLLKY